MKNWIKIATAVVAMTMIMTMLVGCDFARKLNGAEVNFQKKVEAATELSFDMHVSIESENETSNMDISCYKNGEEYAYTFVDPTNTSVVYRRLYADNKLYEYMTKTTLHVGSYYVEDNVDVAADENILYWVTKNIMLATYVTLLTDSKKETLNGTTVYRYDFAYEGNDYSLWYDQDNLVKIAATFRSTDEEGQVHSETYTATFASYRFAEVDKTPFARPADTTGAMYIESPISFEDWMQIIDKFSARAAHWLQ